MTKNRFAACPADPFNSCRCFDWSVCRCTAVVCPYRKYWLDAYDIDTSDLQDLDTMPDPESKISQYKDLRIAMQLKLIRLGVV